MSNTNFIESFKIQDITICDKLIEYYNNNLDRVSDGEVMGGIIPELKKCKDLPINDVTNVWVKKYLDELQIQLEDYMKIYPYSAKYSAFSITEGFNIQYYKPKDAYFSWHTERTGGAEPFNKRHLTWITYLNDVTDGGETEFFHQKIKIKAEKGKTIIFPCDWTFTHKGVVSDTQEKYIVTGWYSFTH